MAGIVGQTFARERASIESWVMNPTTLEELNIVPVDSYVAAVAANVSLSLVKT